MHRLYLAMPDGQGESVDIGRMEDRSNAEWLFPPPLEEWVNCQHAFVRLPVTPDLVLIAAQG